MLVFFFTKKLINIRNAITVALANAIKIQNGMLCPNSSQSSLSEHKPKGLNIQGAMAANYLIVRFLCVAGFLASAIGGLLVTWEHYRAYTSTSLFGNNCKLGAQFPDFLPLDTIAPMKPATTKPKK